MSTVPGAPNQRAAVLSGLRALADAGLLRQLDWALAQFIAEHDPEAAPELLVATALLAHFEGQGHSCLPLGGLRDRLLQLPGWSTAGQETLAALVQSLSPSSADWLAAVRSSRCVQAAQAADTGAPLVLGGSPAAPLLYLRRYWNFEQQVAQGLGARAAPPLDVDEGCEPGWTVCSIRSRPAAAIGKNSPAPLHCARA